VELLFPVQANEVFVELPPILFEGLRKRGWVFYAFIGEGGSRFVCSWACQDAWIDALLADARECLNLSAGETLQ
jgi:threonine aldolase